MRELFAFAMTRRMLNEVYGMLRPRAQRFAYDHFAKIFRSVDRRVDNGSWTLSFGGRRLELPVREDRAWLDWDEAVSVLGHEPWIKGTYAAFLAAATPPSLFVDIGANYGTHSLLFLAHGVDVIAFEPNASCHGYFREACALNGFEPTLHPIALGSERGTAELCYPERETWLGSTNADEAVAASKRGQIIRQPVEVQPLDDFEPSFRGRRALVKIDAEGYELPILRGAERVLRLHRPVVLFEARRGHAVSPLFDLFESHGYRIARLPVVAGAAIQFFSAAQEADYGLDDLIAIPSELCVDRALADGSQVFESPRM